MPYPAFYVLGHVSGAIHFNDHTDKMITASCASQVTTSNFVHGARHASIIECVYDRTTHHRDNIPVPNVGLFINFSDCCHELLTSGVPLINADNITLAIAPAPKASESQQSPNTQVPSTPTSRRRKFKSLPTTPNLTSANITTADVQRLHLLLQQ
ncbi:hypothetical protein C8F04DRAFT_1321381 [Mycena alexandri]|uniref:Uncharacterized protein n=1 Tax=Mycena alexandri TaxID=1745969 RepID=A0AAD6WSR5_9AGAR|nr:hypothetical protein C8F04DRAFT_1321381 [Mycena alexandri]